MSSSLYWRPVVKDENYLGSGLKFALRERFGESLYNEVEIGRADLEWLRGYVAGKGQGADEAKKLIELIEKHDSVIVWEAS